MVAEEVDQDRCSGILHPRGQTSSYGAANQSTGDWNGGLSQQSDTTGADESRMGAQTAYTGDGECADGTPDQLEGATAG